MSKIPSKLRLDKRFDGEIDKVQNMLDDAYLDIAPAVNRKPDMHIEDDTDPTSVNINFSIGTLWLNRDLTGGTPSLYILSDIDETASPRTATWTTII